jgi:hypothetical protein
MKDILSVTHVTSNEDGDEELSVEYKRTVWQRLIRVPGTTRVYVKLGHGGGWTDKSNGMYLSARNHFEVQSLADYVTRSSRGM